MPAPATRNGPLAAYVMLTLAPLFWAGNFVMGRWSAEHVPPLALSCLRWIVASALLLPFALPHLRRDWPQIRAHLGLLLFLGSTGAGFFGSLAYLGLARTTALNALVLNSASPILIVLVCAAVFGDRIGLRQILGLLMAMAGVLAIVARGDPLLLTTLTLDTGDLLVLLAMLLWALYTAYLRLRPKLHWLSFAVTISLLAALVTLPLMAAEHLAGHALRATSQTAMAVLYTGIFPSVLSYILWTRGVEILGGVRAGPFMYLIPLFGAGLAVGLLGEPLRLFHLVGLLLIVAGVVTAAGGRPPSDSTDDARRPRPSP